MGLLRRHGRRAGLSVGVCGLMIWLLIGRLSAIEPAAVAQAFGQLAPQAWGLAALATGLSFWAVGHYDAVIHRHFATGLPQARARAAGICAIAVSQMIGLGVISGAVLRWRMLPEIGPWAATRLTAAVALSFLGAWGMVTSATLVILPGAPFKTAAAGVLAIGMALALVSIAAPRLGRLRLRWPNTITLGQLGALCVVDTMAAALAFYALCPPGVDLTLTLLLPAFLLALGAGLVSGAPGGMGAFEMTLLALLPGQPETGLLAAVLGWRIVYFAVPAILGAGFAIRGPRSVARADTRPVQARPTLRQAPEAEVQILRQGEHRLIGTPTTAQWVAGATSHCLVGFFAPLEPGPRDLALTALSSAALAEGRIPVLYKVRPRLAALARAQGWQVLAMAREAVLTLPSYRLDTPDRSALRRKLRRAEAAGICILSQHPASDAAPDWPALDRIAAIWTQVHGGERGFSMGRYERAYLPGQRLYIALLNDQPIAFVTFHTGPRHWVLDLMRHLPDMPDGTMHLLVHTAIAAAKAAGVPRISLAAVPETAFCVGIGWVAKGLAQVGASGGGAGLLQFKSSFAPRWERRYLCVPYRAALPLAIWEIARAIHRPPALPDPARLTDDPANQLDTATDPANMANPGDTQYAFASAG